MSEDVTQADRKAAENFWRSMIGALPADDLQADMIARGLGDSGLIVQAFKNCRLAAARAMQSVLDEAAFLLDRIGDLPWGDGEEAFARDWYGHVEPPLERLRAAIRALNEETP